MWSYSYLVNALLGSVFSGLALALFAPFVCLRRISYLGEALSHIAFAGIALSILIGMNITLGTLFFVVAIALAITWLSHKVKLQEANTITLFLSISMALGIILISVSKNYSFDLSSYLFGNVLLIKGSEVWVLAILTVLNAAFILACYKELFYLSYSQDISRVFRIKVGHVNTTFMILLAANIVVNLKCAGIILVTAQLILPALTAFNLAQHLPKAIVLSVLISLIAALGGFYFSFRLNLPTGATIVICEAILFSISLLAKRRSM